MRFWIAVLTVFATLATMAQPSSPAWRGYDESADASADIEQARARAVASGKRVLIVFGADWCGDCRVLDMAMKEGRLKALVDARFVVVKVDVARFDRNVDIAQRYGVPLRRGIPTVVVLADDGRASYVTTGGELARARSMGEDALFEFFDRPF